MTKGSCEFILSKGSVERIKEKLKALFGKKKKIPLILVTRLS